MYGKDPKVVESIMAGFEKLKSKGIFSFLEDLPESEQILLS